MQNFRWVLLEPNGLQRLLRYWMACALILTGFAGLAFAEGTAHGTAKSLVLRVGDERTFSLPVNHHIWVQNKNVLSISPRGNKVVLSGNVEGTTSVQIGEDTLQIQVIQPVKAALERAFAKDLQRILGLHKSISHQQVSITGKLYRWEDWLKLTETSKSLNLSYAMAADVPPLLQVRALEYWQRQFKAEGLPPVPVHFAKPLNVKLAVSESVFKKYEEILGPFGILLEKDTEALNIAPVVRVQITVAEIRRDMALSYGIKWPSSYQATLLADGQKEFENLVLTANALEQNGQGKILASPSLLCRSGKSAEFLAGGEFPIKIMGYRSTDVVWKRYGVVLKVQPKADASGRMSIALETEVSTVDNSRTVDGIPGLLTNRISSHFDLSRSRTIVLSGLIKNEDSKSAEGLPGLGRIPILGALFSSRDFKENRTELVILVRPTIMDEFHDENALPGAAHLGDVAGEAQSLRSAP